MRQHTLVEAPDAFAGFTLAERLVLVAPDVSVEPDGEAVWVAFDLELETLPRALHLVQRWLEEERIDTALVRLSDREFRIAA